MYFLAIAVMLSTGITSRPPVVVAEFSSLADCQQEIVQITELANFYLTTHPLIGKSVTKLNAKGTTVAFCVQDVRSV